MLNKQAIQQACFMLFEHNVEIRVLKYMMLHAPDNLYFAGKGSRSMLCDRLKISKNTYASSINKLLKYKVIAKRKNARQNQYYYYEILLLE